MAEDKKKKLAELFLHASRREGDTGTCSACDQKAKKVGNGSSNLWSNINWHHKEYVSSQILSRMENGSKYSVSPGKYILYISLSQI